MINIVLIGIIGDEFGSHWRLSVNTVAEAIRAIASQKEHFIDWLIDRDKEGIAYQISIDGETISDDQLKIPVGSEIIISPVSVFSGDALRIVTGVALIASSFIFPAGLLGISSTTIALYGSAMVLGGIFQLLSPKPDNKSGNNQSSYGLDGSQFNKGYQGQCVPVAFGTYLLENPIPISIRTENENIPIDFVPS